MPADEKSIGLLQGLTAKARRKIRNALNTSSSKTTLGDALEELEDSPAFNASKFLKSAHNGPTGLPEKTLSVLKGTASIVRNPKNAIKNRATRKAASKLAKSRPMLSRKADLDFLEAHDEMERAQEELSQHDGLESKSQDEEVEEHIDTSAERIKEKEDSRTKMKVAWVTSRHIHRVRAVDTTPPPFPEDSFFEEDDEFVFKTFNWTKWVAYKLLHISHRFSAQYVDDFRNLPYDKETLRLHIERLIIVSAPIQILLSDVRQVYRWEDPYRTAKWLFLYLFFWYISHITTFIAGLIIYSTLWKYYHPSPVHDIRTAIDRSANTKTTALNIGELMDRHGSRDWLIPLLEPTAPYIQLQLADLANLLEALSNFYTFQSPPATFATLCLIGAYFITSLFSDSEFILKLFWFMMGFTFFGLWPISSRYPRYRLLVSPTKWALWNVPTEAEMCFQYLRERAAIVKDSLLSDGDTLQNANLNSDIDSSYDSDSSADSFQTALSEQVPTKDLISFRCTHHHKPGHLILSTSSIRFSSHISLSSTSTSIKFSRSLNDLVEITKQQANPSSWNPLSKTKIGLGGLSLQFRSQIPGPGCDVDVLGQDVKTDTFLLENMRGRDRAFNALIGFSGLEWQHLQRGVDTEAF